MSSIVFQKVGRFTYLYESVSYRTLEGKPRNKRTLIGKIDPKTGNPIFKPDYVQRMLDARKPFTQTPSPVSFSDEEIRYSFIKEFGAFYLYQKVAEKIGLLNILQTVFPETWREIFDLSCFFVSSGEPVMYCEDWLAKTEGLPAELSSPKASMLLQSIGHKPQEDFFNAWGAYRREREYLALDITSISSYSQLINTAEWGYNRDGEKLPQVNLCLLLGESSRLPVFQMLYNGSLKDVSTLKTSLSLAFSIGRHKLTLVMDKGFFSRKNISFLLDGKENTRFLLAMPFTTQFAKNALAQVRASIDNPAYAIPVGRESIQGVMKELDWDATHRLYTHVYYNMIKAAEIKSCIYGYVASLVTLAEANPDDPRYSHEFHQYLSIRKSEKTGRYRVTIRRDVVEAELSHAGWMVLISNHIKDPKEAFHIYRAKDVVEKGFFRLKNDLDFHRLRIHSDTAMRGKLFVGFISLIILSHIHTIMLKYDMYKKWTLKELIRQLEKLHVQYISGNRILFPLTKSQKEIFRNFGVDLPV